MSEGDRRSAKLHKQTEVDDDSEEGISTPPPPSQSSPPSSPTSTTTIANQTSGVQCKNLCNIPTPTVVPASSSSSSETSPEEPPTPTPPQPPATLSRKQTLTRTPAFEGTSPPPETFLAHHDPSSSSDHSSSSTTTTTIISAGSNGGSNSSRSIIPSISTTSPPLVTTSTHPVPNGGTVTVSTLSVTSDASSGTGRIRGISVAHQAKEFLLASHTVSNDSGRGTLDDSCDILHRESSVDTSGSLANISSSSPSTPPASSTPTSLSPAYTDSTGTDLIPFFKATLRKSPKDKKTLLAVEREIIAFIGDLASQSHKMNEMNPYDRMVAHRVAAYYGLDHNVDQSGKCIIVTRTTKTRMPDLKLCDIPNTLEEKRILLKKPSSLDEQQVKRLTTKDKFGTNRAKSLEERQQNYHEVRERIFKVDESPIVSKEGQSTSISSSNLLTHPSFQQHYHHHPPMSQQRSLDSMRDARQQQQQQHSTPHHHLHHQPHSFSRPLWSSTDSSGYESLGGPSIYESPPSHPSTHELSNTPTGSMSDQSPASRPASETGHSPLTQPPPQYQPTVTYLVTTDLANKPSNSCIINPETMQPHVNPDGTTVYQYDVSCPPPFMMGAAQPAATATQISPAGFVYQTDPVYDLTSRFAGTSLTPMEGMVAGGPDHMTLGIQPGQTVSLVPSQGQPSNLIQTQYINGSQVVGQPVRYIYTLPPAGGGAGGSVGVGPPIHQPHLTSSPAAGPIVLDASAHHHHHPSLHPSHHHPHHQVTTVVPMPSTAVAASPMIPTAGGNGATAGGYQIINPSTAYIQTANGLSGVNLSVTPVPVSSSAVVGGSIPIDLSSLTPEQQQSVLAAAAAGGGTVVCSNPNGPQQTLSALVNHPQAFPPGGVAHPQAVTAATAAIPVSGGAPNVIQAYTIAPYQLSNVATVPLAHHHQQQQQQQQLQQQQQQQQLLQHHLQHQSSLTHTHLVQSQQQQQHPQHGSSSVPTPSIPPPSSSMPPPASSSASAAAFFTGMPLTNTSNSPSPLSHQTQQHPPPPPHHHPHHHHTHPHQHQQQQPAIVYNIGGVPMISTLPPTSSSLSLPPPPPPPPLQPASSSSSSLSSSKSNPGPASSSIGGQFTTTSTSSSSSGSSSTSAYQQTPPPGAPTMQQLHHPHHHHHHQHPPPPPPSSSSSTPSSSSNNGYHSHPHLHSHPSSYSQSPSSTISFIPNQSQHHTGAAPPQQQQAMMTGSGGNGSPQLVTIPTAATATGSPYQHPQLRPMNTIIPMPGVPGAPGSTTAAPTHFQLVRPTGPMQDVRMLQPGAFPTRLPSVPIYAPFAQQAGRPRGSNPNRPGKGSKKYGSRESGYGQVSGAALQHPQSQPQPQQPPQRKQHTPQPQQQPLVAAPPPPPQQHQIAPSSNSIFPSPHLPPASCRP